MIMAMAVLDNDFLRFSEKHHDFHTISVFHYVIYVSLLKSSVPIFALVTPASSMVT